MRILHVSQPVTAGVATVVGDLVRTQVKSGHEVHLASPQGPLAATIASVARWHEWPATRSPGLEVLGEVRRLAHLLRQVAPNVVHLHSSKAGLCGRLLLRGRLPTIFQPHGWSFLAVDGRQASLCTAWERFGTRWTSALVCVSSEEEAIGRRLGISAHFVRRPNAVHLARFGDVDRATARQTLGLPHDDPVVLCVARLTGQKGVDLLLDTWQPVRAEVPRSHLYVVGDGRERPGLEARARHWPEVHFVGARDDVPLWYSAADLVVLPSRYEGMALTPLEAMASGRAVVGFDVPGFRESLGQVVGPDPVAMREDTTGLASIIVKRLSNHQLLESDGARNLRHVSAHHDDKEAGAEMLRLYRSLLPTNERARL